MMTQNKIEQFARDNDLDADLVARMARWMDSNAYDYQDRRTAEVNYTGLAEAAAGEFETYEDDSDYVIPEWVFDLATLASK